MKREPWVPVNLLHHKGENTRSFLVYSVWDNRTDELVIVDGEAAACAKAMKLSLASFYSTVSRVASGKLKRWTIRKRFLDGEGDVYVGTGKAD